MKATTTVSRRLPLAVGFFGFVLIGTSGGASGVLLPSLSAFYHVNDAVLGTLFFVSSIGYFLSALSCGPLTEKLGLRWLLILGATTFLVGALGFGLEPPFIVVLLFRLLIGLGVGMLETGLNIYITALPHHTSLLNNLHAFYGVGALVGPLGASLILALSLGWNTVYLLLCLLIIPMLCGFLAQSTFNLSQPTHEEERHDEQQEQDTTDKHILRAALKLPVVWLAASFLLVYVGIEVSLGNWAFTFLLDTRHEGTVVAGWIVSGYWLGLTLGRFVLQRSAERLGMSNRDLMYACMAGIVIGILLIWLLPNGIAAGVGFCFIGFSLGPIYPLTVALTPQLVPPRLAPSTIGFLVSLSIIGLALFPWIAGILAQSTSFVSLLPYTLGLVALMLCCWQPLVRLAPKIGQRVQGEH
jgi:fucose permease